MRKKRTLLTTLLSLCSFVLSYLIFKFTKLMTYAISAPANSDFKDFPLWALNLVPIITLIFAFNSLSYAFALYDKAEYNEFIKENRTLSFFTESKRIVLSPLFALKFATISILTVVFSFAGGFPEFEIVFSAISEVPSLMGSLLPILIIIPHFTLISLISSYEARRYWSYAEQAAATVRYEKHGLYSNLHAGSGADMIFSPLKIIARFAVIFIGYPLIFPYLPYLAFAVITVLGIAFKLSVVLTVFGFVGLVALIFGLWIGISYLIAIRKRKSFIKRLLVVALKKGYTVSEIKHSTLSFFKRCEGASFTLTRGDKSYACRFISTRSQRTPLYFLPHGDAYFLHRLGTKKHHISLHHNISYAFDDERDKILLINPFPKQVFVSENGRVARISPIDKIWDYLVYDDITFLGALSRDCVGRTKGKFE